MSLRRRGLPDGRTRILGIVGRPLEHSLSPALQTAVLRALDRNLIYLPLPVSEDRLPALLAEAPGLGILGFNVTTPFKEVVARLVRPQDEETVRTGMVNTVTFTPEGPTGCGTDGEGILRYLGAAGYGDASYGILGFGATARSLAHRGWRDGRPPAAVVTRRAEAVRKVLADWDAGEVRVLDWACWGSAGVASVPGSGALEAERPDLPPWPDVWVSTIGPEAPPLPDDFWARGRNTTVLLDMNYGAGRTRRREEASHHGWRSADGLGPLCHQAALSLSLWLGTNVPVDLYFRALGRAERSLRPGR